jgi:hypothetical protein
MPTNVELLTTLRNTDRARDWETWEGTLETLLSRLPVPTMLRLAQDEVRRRLPVFEGHHPHIRWPRVWLDALRSGEPFTFDDMTPEAMEETPGPGGNSFTEAVRRLALAAAASGSHRVTHTQEAISGAIVAERREIAGSKYRELWDLYYQEKLRPGEETEEEQQQHKYGWVSSKLYDDPDAAAVEVAAWNRLADEIAIALDVPGIAEPLVEPSVVPTETAHFARLRYAARYRDPIVGCEALEALFPRLSVPTMVRLAQDEVRRRLPLFEKHHPQIRWPRGWLDALVSGEPCTFDASTPEVSEQAPGPGGNNFIEAVKLLALATAAEGSQRVRLTAEAIAWALLVDGLELGGSKDRERWDRWFQALLNHEEFIFTWTVRNIDNDPDVAAVETAGWNRLIDALAAAFGVPG